MANNIIDGLKKRLLQPLPGELAHNAMAPSNRPLKKATNSQLAGVMLLLYNKEGKTSTVFMKRTEYPGVHSGQISFPGGKKDVYDETIIETALRETEEEFGVPGKNIEIIGNLTPLHIPVSGFDVFPVIGYLKSAPVFKIDLEEVAYTIEVDIDFLCSPDIKKTEFQTWDNKEVLIPYFEIDDNKIWGATAMILNEFLEIWKSTK